MLAERDAAATIAVKDLDTAKKFYEGTLGLKPSGGQDSEVRVYRSGNSRIVVYQSQYAGTNQANAVTWGVGDDLDGIVQTLKAKGVVFEHYDLPGLTRKGDVHVAGKFKAAWFKDPDGNILHINSG
jgi:catechol 2,3-dioxygenase-like lactoylglutathione lyase family enzyme